MLGSQLQDSALPDRLRVGEAVELFATERARDGGRTARAVRAGRAPQVGLRGLSGGERQRLFLVLALLNRPRLVILDELTQGLDPAARRDVWSAVAQLRDEGTTVLLVTHELDEAEVLCDRVIAMRGGRVLDQGAPIELVDRHAPAGRTCGSAGTRRGTQPSSPSCARLPGVHDGARARRRRRPRRPRVDRPRRRRARAARPRPRDLHVELPDLEAALLHLLERTVRTSESTPTSWCLRDDHRHDCPVPRAPRAAASVRRCA